MRKYPDVKFDFVNNTITFSKKFLEKASEMGTDEFSKMVRIQHQFPNMEMVHPASRTHTSITYKQMARYITYCVDEAQREAYKKAFAEVKEASKGKPNPYAEVRNWFKKTFPDYKEPLTFDENNQKVIPFKKPEVKETSPEKKGA